MKRIKISKDNFFIKSKADFKKVEKAPDREPDYTSYKTFIAWGHEVWGVDKDKNGEVICVHFDVEDLDDDWGYDIVSYDVVDTFIGNKGDTGYRCLDKNNISSAYWYTEDGVFRKSKHWGECRNCCWKINGEAENSSEYIVGFCKWEDFKEVDKFFLKYKHISKGKICVNLNKCTQEERKNIYKTLIEAGESIWEDSSFCENGGYNTETPYLACPGNHWNLDSSKHYIIEVPYADFIELMKLKQKNPFKFGDKVFHPKYGEGRVSNVDIMECYVEFRRCPVENRGYRYERVSINNLSLR